MHEQKFKDLSSTCQVSVERTVEVHWFTTRGEGGNILLCSSCSKASDANIGTIANFV